jgi:hypothetical protein
MISDIEHEARNSETSPARLQQIFEEARRRWLSDPQPQVLAVLGHLAVNPSTPQSVLLQLAARFPHEFLRNPLLPLLHLEDADFAHKLPPETVRGLLCAEDLPPWLLPGVDSLATKRQPHISEDLANHVRRVGEAGDDWRSRAAADMKSPLQQQAVDMRTVRGTHGTSPAHAAMKADLVAPWLKEALLEAMNSVRRPAGAQASSDAPAPTLQQQARHDQASPAELRALAQEAARPVRVAVARHPQAPRDVLKLLAEDADSWVRGAVARNENAPSALLEALARDEHSVVRATVARHPLTPAQSLEHLASDNDLEVLAALQHRSDLPANLAQAVVARQKQCLAWGTSRPPEQQARDPQTPTYVLERLALSPSASLKTRRRVGRNPRANRRTQEALALDQSVQVRRAVAQNPAVPYDVLRVLADDPLYEPRQAVAQRIQTPVEMLIALAKDRQAPVREAVARNLATPPEVLRQLSAQSNLGMRQALASNPHTPADILLRYAQEKAPADQNCLAELTANRSLPTEGVQALSEQLEAAVQESARKAAQSGLPLQPNSSAGYSSSFSRWRDVFEFHKQDSLLRSLLRHPHAPHEVQRRAHELRRQALLLWLAASEQVWERAVALSCPEIPTLILQANLSHPRWEWRYAIARNSGTPREWLEVLARDGHRWVRAAGQAALRSENVHAT